MQSLFAELKRRSVIRVGGAYLIAAWVLAQVADLALKSFGAPRGQITSWNPVTKTSTMAYRIRKQTRLISLALQARQVIASHAFFAKACHRFSTIWALAM